MSETPNNIADRTADPATPRAYFTLRRIACDIGISFAQAQALVERLGISPVYSINDIGHYDDAARMLIARSIAASMTGGRMLSRGFRSQPVAAGGRRR